MIENAIYYRFSNYAGLTALTSTRIYPVVMPQNTTLPACVYRVISAIRNSAMGADINISTKRIQVDSYGATYATAKAVSEQVRYALQRFSGTVDSVIIHNIFIDNDFDYYDGSVPDENRVTQDFLVTFTEA